MPEPLINSLKWEQVALEILLIWAVVLLAAAWVVIDAHKHRIRMLPGPYGLHNSAAAGAALSLLLFFGCEVIFGIYVATGAWLALFLGYIAKRSGGLAAQPAVAKLPPLPILLPAHPPALSAAGGTPEAPAPATAKADAAPSVPAAGTTPASDKSAAASEKAAPAVEKPVPAGERPPVLAPPPLAPAPAKPVAGFVKGTCRHCAGHLEFATEMIGRTIACPHCRQAIELAANLESEPAPAKPKAKTLPKGILLGPETARGTNPIPPGKP